jgi:hypothetical protein
MDVDLSSIANAANITFGTNPTYTIADFLAVYPQFGAYAGDPPVWSGVIPEAVLQMYINLASACLSQERWCDSWQVGMALFVAHFATLYLQSTTAPGSSAAQVAQAGQAKGVLVSKAVGDVSGSYQQIVSDIDGWAAWKLTTFGQQLLTMARLIGKGGMYVW